MMKKTPLIAGIATQQDPSQTKPSHTLLDRVPTLREIKWFLILTQFAHT